MKIELEHGMRRPLRKRDRWLAAGLLIVATAVPAYRGFGPGLLALLGSALLALRGIELAGAGIFHCDLGCPLHGSVDNDIHIELARGGLFCGSLAPLAFSGQRLRSTRFRAWTLLSLVTALVLFALAFAPVETRFPGARQRAFLAVFYLWLGGSCLWLRARS
jgi:hypothetical protein